MRVQENILFVDDDSNLLDSYKRQLRKQFQVLTALGGAEGLESIKKHGPFAVIVSDMRMPEMDGVQFLAKVRERAPDSVRIMLTGNADVQTAIEAVNEGNVFRFLTKPCSPEAMTKALDAGLEQYRLINAERELLENTLKASVNVLTEILSLVNPTAFGRASRMRGYVKHIAMQMKVPDLWQYEVAAMLSQIGCVTLPQSILNKIYSRKDLTYTEQKMYNSHPKVGCKLLAGIPRLDQSAHMIEGQQTFFKEYPPVSEIPRDKLAITLGAQMLKLAIDFDQLVIRAISPKGALSALQKRTGEYNPKLLEALENFEGSNVEVEFREVSLDDLEIGMVIDEHVRSENRTLLVPKGHEVTYTVLERLRNFAHGGTGIQQPIRVRVPIQESFTS
jgi:response regulator RpfG family c-di-GMP phosphodiesterase